MKNFKQFVGVFVCAMLLFGVGNAAATTIWNNTGTGDWNDTNNWTSGIPTALPANNTAQCDNGGTAQISGSMVAPHLFWNVGNIDILAGGTLNLGQHDQVSADWMSFLGDDGSAKLSIYDGNLIVGAVGGDPQGGYAFVCTRGSWTPERTSGIDQMGGTATFTDLRTVRWTDDQTGSYQGLVLSLGPLPAYYKISGGSLSLVDCPFYIGKEHSSGPGNGTFEVVGTGPTSITMGGLVRVSGGSKILADIGATGITKTEVTGDVEFVAGAKLKVNDTGAVAGTYTVMSWTGASLGSDLTLDAPAGWSMAVVTDPITFVSSLQVTLAQSAVLGDLNWSGVTNNQDINPFVLALTNLAAWQAQYPGKDVLAVGDCSLDGNFNNQDINPFIAILTGGGAAVPEPVTLSVIGLGGLALLKRKQKSCLRP